MPKQAEDRVGKTYGRWVVIKENKRTISKDNGIIYPKTRNFMVKCVHCGWVKENVSWKNVTYNKIGHKCINDELQQQQQHIEKHQGLLNGRKWGLRMIGKIIENVKGIGHKINDVKVPPIGKYNYLTLLYNLSCTRCRRKKDVIYQCVIAGEFSFCKCEIIKKEKTRAQMIEEMDNELNNMLELSRKNQLIDYLIEKFGYDEVMLMV